MQGAFSTSGASDAGLGLDRPNDSLRNGAFENQRSVSGGSGFSQGRPGTPGTPQGNRTPSGAHQQVPIGPSFAQGRPGTPGTPQGGRTPTSAAHQQGPIGPFSRQQSGNQSRPEVPHVYYPVGFLSFTLTSTVSIIRYRCRRMFLCSLLHGPVTWVLVKLLNLICI